MKKNILIIHYNTPYLTECLVRSINLFVEDAIIYIFDNSDKKPFTAKFDNVTIIDNTKGQIINFDEWIKQYSYREKTSAKRNNFGSAKHAYSVQKCIEILGENFILLDSDILLKRDISDMFSDEDIFVGTTEFWKARTSVAKRVRERAIPYICFINVNKCKEYNIKYFDSERIYGLSLNGDNYDTGASFLEDIKEKNLRWKRISISPLIVHYKAGSWVEDAKKYDGYKQISIEDWLGKNKKYWSNEKNTKVIYTCITGGYDGLIDPKYVSEGFDYICFTDNPSIKSDIWDIKPLPIETEELPQIKKQRFVKMHPHLLLKEYDISIWVDGNVIVEGDLNKFVSENINDEYSIYVPTHPQRDCIYVEEKIVVRMGKDKSNVTKPQIERYKKDGYPSHNGLLQSNILLRKHNEKDCIKLMEEWFKEVKNGSHRDQLSFNYISWKNNDIKVKYLDKYIFKSNYFHWDGSHRKNRVEFTNVANQGAFATQKKNKHILNKKTKSKSIAQLKDEFYQMINSNKIPTYDVGIY